MLWLCLFLPQFPLELRQPAETGLAAIAQRKGSRRFLSACTPEAQAAGIAPGLDAITALTREPGLRLIERSPAQEKQALKALAAWADQFSGFVCFDLERRLLWMEIGSSLRYFGGLDALLERVSGSLQTLGYTAAKGVAPTLEAAALLARHGAECEQPHRILRLDELREV